MVQWVGDSTQREGCGPGLPVAQGNVGPLMGLSEAVIKNLDACTFSNKVVPVPSQSELLKKLEEISDKLFTPLKVEASPHLVGLLSQMRAFCREQEYQHGSAAQFVWYMASDVYRAVMMDVCIQTGHTWEDFVANIRDVEFLGYPMMLLPGLRPGRYVLRRNPTWLASENA